MKNKLIFLLIVFGLFFGLLFIISKNRAEREKLEVEENRITARKQFILDSLQKIEEKKLALRMQETELNERSVSQKRLETELIQKKMKEEEEFSSYINSSIKNSSNNTEVSVTIVDENGNISTSVSSAIANIYNQIGKKGNTGLLRSSFVHKTGFQELFEGNSDIISRLKLSSHTDYLALGKIKYSMRQGTLVEGTIICVASISMSIISASTKTMAKSFSFSVNGNGVTESQAKEEAFQKLVNIYYNEYSSI